MKYFKYGPPLALTYVCLKKELVTSVSNLDNVPDPSSLTSSVTSITTAIGTILGVKFSQIFIFSFFSVDLSFILCWPSLLTASAVTNKYFIKFIKSQQIQKYPETTI